MPLAGRGRGGIKMSPWCWACTPALHREKSKSPPWLVHKNFPWFSFKNPFYLDNYSLLNCINCIISKPFMQTKFYLSDMNWLITKSVYATCEQQRHRSACTSAQSDQPLCYSLHMFSNIYSCRISEIGRLANFLSWMGCFGCYLVVNLWWHIFSWCGSRQRKPVFKVSDQVRIKPACSTTATSFCLEISALASRGNILIYYPGSKQQRRWSGCADAQADLRLCCSHMA